MATVRDIAALVGVSIATVSRVLNNSNSVAPETVEKVYAAINELNYQRKLPKRKRTNLFGIIVPNITNPFFSELLDVIEKEAFHHGRCVLFFNSRNSSRQEKLYLEECRNHKVDGVFLIPSSVDKDYLKEIKQYAFPTVLLTNVTDIVPSVSVDHAAGGALIAEHFIAAGHTQIGYVGPINDNEEKLQGFMSLLDKKNHPLRKEFMFDYDLHEDSSKLKGFIEGLLDETGKPRVSAVYCSNDVTAGKVLKHLWSLHINVPEQIVVVGFNNSLTAKTLDITSVSQPIREIAHTGFEVMLECLQEGEKQQSYLPKILLPRLVIRNPEFDTRQMQHR